MLGIGQTLFSRVRNLERVLDFERIFVKFEAGNPTGTMKDRASFGVLEHAKKKGMDTIVVASCGNYGASVVYLSRFFGITPHVYIPEKYETSRIGEMERLGGIIHREPGTYEELVDFSGIAAEENGWYNGNPGVKENTEVSMKAYQKIAYEIFDSLEYAPCAVSVSTSNGTCLAGIYNGFKKLRRRGRSDKIPRIICASTDGGNPIVSSFKSGLKKIENLHPEDINETPLNEPIVNWRSLDGHEALDALWGSDGYASAISDPVMEAFSTLLEQEEGLSVLPASAASLAALSEYVKVTRYVKENSFVAVLTGRRY